MRLLTVAVLSLVAAGAGCTNPIDPESANLTGSVASLDVSASRLGLRTENVYCVTAPCYDYSVHVTGKVYRQDASGRYERISVAEIPVGVPVLVWTTGVVLESYPAQVEATRVVVPFQDEVIYLRDAPP